MDPQRQYPSHEQPRRAQRPQDGPAVYRGSPRQGSPVSSEHSAETRRLRAARRPQSANTVQKSRAVTKAAPLKPVKKVKSDRIRQSDIVLQKNGVDRFMLIITVVLLCFGSIMVFSASYPNALVDKGDSLHYIRKQMVFIGIGTVLIVLICKIFNYRVIRRLTPLYFAILSFLLILVPIYGLAEKKAVRWLPIFGFQFQPSEFMKLGLVLMLAFYLEKNQAKINDYSRFWRSSLYGVFIPFCIVAWVCALIAVENHFSCVIIMFLLGTVVIFVAGARLFWLILFGGLGVGVVGSMILFTDYAKRRIDIWLHPENYPLQDDIWQTVQGLIAVGSGGLLGLGLGQGRQKHLYVPEPQNDFIFSIVCEELGFVGALAVIVLFGLFIWRGLVIAFHAPDTFASLTAIGIVSKIAIQMLLNMLVVTNTIPNTGISLPFFSYGGSALLSTMMECGVLLSISQYSYQEKS